MRIRLKRYLFLTHRWLGIVACVFFAMWFISGLVMMYVGYPKLTERERLQHLPAIDAQLKLLTPRQALDAAGIAGPLSELRLANASGGKPVYIVVAKSLKHDAAGHKRASRGKGAIVIDAQSGEQLLHADVQRALASAAAYAGHDISVAYLDSVDEDAFTHSRRLDAYRPLHRIQLGDGDATQLYVSSKTGEVVLDASGEERVWNYAGAWIHWLYPFRGNLFDPYQADIVIWLSILGTVAAVTGTVVGIMRWRFSTRYRNGSRSPYQGGIMRWHHLIGMLFALITITWIFSGLMSMNPWKIFDSGAVPLRIELMQGGPLTISGRDASPKTLLAAAGRPVNELHWMQTLSVATVQAYGAAGAPILLNSQTAQSRTIDLDELLDQARKLLPQSVARFEQLNQYDLYYYARAAHTMGGGTEKPLPIMRVIFDDAHATWVHIDLHTGAVLGKIDNHRRTSRWLFAMLHSWDWLPLLERRPLWDILLILFSVGGAALSITGVIIGWRRLGKKLRA